VLNNHSELWL